MQVPTPDIQLSFYVRFYVSRQKAKKNRWIEWKIFHGCFENKKEKKTWRDWVS